MLFQDVEGRGGNGGGLGLGLEALTEYTHMGFSTLASNSRVICTH